MTEISGLSSHLENRFQGLVDLGAAVVSFHALHVVFGLLQGSVVVLKALLEERVEARAETEDVEVTIGGQRVEEKAEGLASYSDAAFLVVATISGAHRSGPVDQEDHLGFLIGQVEAGHEGDHGGEGVIVVVVGSFDENCRSVRLRVRDENYQVSVEVRGQRGQFAAGRELPVAVGRVRDHGLEGVTRTRHRNDFRLRNNVEVEGQRGRSGEAVGDRGDDLGGLAVVSRRNVTWRYGRRNGQSNGLWFGRKFGEIVRSSEFGRKFGDVDDADLGSGTRSELAEADPKDVRGRFFEEDCGSEILKRKILKVAGTVRDS